MKLRECAISNHATFSPAFELKEAGSTAVIIFRNIDVTNLFSGARFAPLLMIRASETIKSAQRRNFLLSEIAFGAKLMGLLQWEGKGEPQ